MKAQTAIQKMISQKLDEARTRNPAYSIRAFAKRLGISPTTLSRILNGRRSVSQKLASQLSDRMALSPSESQAILSLFPQKRSYQRLRSQSAESENSMVLTMDQYHVVSEWFHFGLRALLRTSDARKSPKHCQPEWLAKRLGIKPSEAKKAIERLLRLEMIERLPDGRLRATETSFHSPDGTPLSSIRRNHAQHLDLARNSLENDSIEKRDFTNLVMAINPKNIPAARALIRHFRKEMESLLQDKSSGDFEEVYSLAIQLFPLTRDSIKKVSK